MKDSFLKDLDELSEDESEKCSFQSQEAFYCPLLNSDSFKNHLKNIKSDEIMD